MSTFIQDVRFGSRMLLKKPMFTAVAVLMLALGIGATTAIFSVVNAVLLRGLPYQEPDRIVMAKWRCCGISASPRKYLFWKEHVSAFEDIAATSPSAFNLVGAGEPLRVQGLRATESFFRVFGLTPAAGAFFTGKEDQPGGDNVVILTDGLWKRVFGGDPGVVGRQIRLNDRSYTVTGVMPAGFQFHSQPDVIVPMQISPDSRELGNSYQLTARMRPGLSLEQAQADMDRVFEAYRADVLGGATDNATAGERGTLVGMQEYLVGDYRKSLFVLFGAVGFVLLIACANVANLMLGRASSRAGEMAIRTALGADRKRLLRQLMTENLLLSLISGGLGVLIAVWSVPALVAAGPADLPRAGEIGVDAPALLFALAAAVLTSLVFGLAPAWRASRTDINEALKSAAGKAGAGRAGARLRGALIAGEVALSLVLLIGAALLIKTFFNLNSVPLGFTAENLVTMQTPLTGERYATGAQVWDFERRVLDRLRALPGVTAAAAASSLPMVRGLNSNINVEGRNNNENIYIEYRAVSPDYFRTLGMTVQQGRGFEPSDTKASEPVLIINDALARRYWNDRSPIGDLATVNKGMPAHIADQPRQIVGVVSSIREFTPGAPAAPTIYVPYAQIPDGLLGLMNRVFPTAWVIRTETAETMGESLRSVIRAEDAHLPVTSIRSMSDVVGASIRYETFLMMLMLSFSVLALLLTVVGIYGVLSYQISEGTKEIGLRIALGAQPTAIVRFVVWQGMAFTLAGVAAGSVAAFFLTRYLSSLLYGIEATDPVTFVVAPFILLGVALAACFIPARRATKVDPMVALRCD